MRTADGESTLKGWKSVGRTRARGLKSGTLHVRAGTAGSSRTVGAAGIRGATTARVGRQAAGAAIAAGGMRWTPWFCLATPQALQKG